MLLGLLFATIVSPPMQDTPLPTLARWERVGGDERGEFSIDPQTMTRTGDRVRVYIRLHLQADDEGPEIIGVMRYVFDCKARTVRQEENSIYEADRKTVRSVRVVPVSEQKDQPFDPETPYDAIATRVCR